jgi:ankyrin repeat protein
MFRRSSRFTLVLFLLLPIACGVDSEKFARAVIQGDRDAVKSMLADGADPSIRFGGDPLVLISAHKGHAEIIKDLVSAGADVDAANNGRTALVAATQQDHPECVNALIEAGTDLDAIGYGNTALMLGSEFGHLECVDLLLAAKAAPDRQNKEGWTATMFAAYNGKDRILDALISGGADLNLRARNGVSALGYAYMKRRATCAEKLKAAGAVK